MSHDSRSILSRTSSPAHTSTVVLCLLTALCEGIDLQAAGVAAVGIATEFKPSPNVLGTFFSASTFGLLFGALLGGRLADSIGRKPVLVSSVILFGVFSVMTSFGWDAGSLTWARVLTGLGLGGALPMIIALVTESAAPERQSASVAMVYAATPLGGAIASLISLLIGSSHWRWIFVIGGVVPLLLAPWLAYRLVESAAFRRSRSGRGSGSFAELFVHGRAARTLLLWASFFLGLLLLYLLLNWLPTLLMSRGMTLAQAAAAQLGFNFGGCLAAVLMGYLLMQKHKRAAVIVTFAVLPLLLVALAKAPSNGVIIFCIVFVLGCSVLAAQAFLYAMAPLTYPTRIRGSGVGAAIAVGRMGSIVGPKLGGALKSAGHGPSQLLMDLVPLVVVGSICALILAWVTWSGRSAKGDTVPLDG